MLNDKFVLDFKIFFSLESTSQDMAPFINSFFFLRYVSLLSSFQVLSKTDLAYQWKDLSLL